MAGRRVVAHLGMVPGGYAEQAVTAVESLHVVPAGTGFADAVALVGTGRTALGVFELAPPTADDVVLVLSGGRWAGLAAGAGGLAGLAARSVELGGRGWWRPLVSTYPLAEAAAAHADLEGRRALGKVVLTVGG